MKIKKMMLVGIILLAILMVGAVSAGEDANFNETLTVNEIQETTDVSLDDNIISGDGGNLSASPDENLLADDYFEVELEVNESVFSTNPDELNVAFAKVTVPEGSEGKVIFEDEDGNWFFEKNLSEFIEQHKQTQDDRITYSIYLNEGNPFLFDGFKEGDWFKFAVLNIYDEELNNLEYFIRFVDDDLVRFERDWHNPGDHVEIDVNTDFSINDEEDFVWINLPNYITAGKVMVTCGEFNLFESVLDDEFNYPWGIAGDLHYFCAFKPTSLDHWQDLNNADIITFSFLDENNETMAFIKYKFYISGEDVHLDELPTSQNFDCWISSHECKNNDEARICEIWIDGVDEGSIILAIEKFDGTPRQYYLSVETDYLQCNLEALDIFDETGKYTVNITYSCDYEIPLVENHEFTLTNLEYDTCEDVYVDYPFDVIRFYTERGEYIKVYVDGKECQSGGEYPLRWKLINLEIDRAGQYTITIKSYDGEDGLIEEFSYGLNVFDESDEVILYSSELGLGSWESDGPVLYLICPDNEIGEHFILCINDNYFDDFDAEYFMSWTIDELGLEKGEDYGITLFNDENDEIASAWISISEGDESHFYIWDEDEDGILYSDMDQNIVDVAFPMGTSGLLYVLVDGEVRYATLARYRDDDDSENSYVWSLATLNMTAPKRYNVTLVFFDGENNETLNSQMVNVVKFDNNSFRVRYDSSTRFVEVFCPDGSEGDITLYIYDGYEMVHNETRTIDSTYYNQWNKFFYEYYDFIDGYDAVVYINGEEIRVEKRGYGEDDNYRESEWISIMEGEVYPGDIIVEIECYYSKDVSDANITITNGDYRFFKEISEFDIYEWRDHFYEYRISFEDLDSFENFNDKDKINFTFESKYGKQTKHYVIQKNNGIAVLHRVEELINDGSDLFDRLFPDDEEDAAINTSEENVEFIRVTVPKNFNVTKAEIIISSGDKIVFNRTLTEFDYEFDYEFAMDTFTRTYLLEEMDLSCLNDKDVVNFTLIFDGNIMETDQYVYHILGDDLIEFYRFMGEIEADVHWGEVGYPEFGPGNHDGSLILLDIPDYLNITEGTIQITDDAGNVLYSASLSEINATNDRDVTHYVIMADGFPYDTAMPDGVNLTFSFNYNDTQLVFGKGIRIGHNTYRHVMPEQVEELFTITLPDGVLVNGEDNVIYIYVTPAANRQSVPIGLGDGYFAVYVNGKRIENLGRLIRVDGETELDVLRLEMDFRNFYLYLPDLNITENGIYDIRITYEVDDYSETTGVGAIDLYRNNVTLTSNVKPNYQNSSVEWLTGYGLDPNLLYLDTYYGVIDEVTGRITVLNDNDEVILESDIKDLPLKDGRRYLKYSDFTDSFGDKITLKYSDGSERNGETNLDVLWRNVTSDDFAPAVDSNVEDYYGNFINLNIPDAINEGQIIVTVKFTNNKGTNISNMNVSKDFDSQAVYRFNIADIKASCGNQFAFSLSDLEFYEDNGDYDIDVKFTADNVNVLNITANTLNVELLKDVLITINDTSRYGMTLPFAGVKIFEPINAYAELYIDNRLYSKMTFEKGLIIFESSPRWAPGTHFAEIMVFNSEFGSLLNSSNATFETKVKTDDVNININTIIRENENATFTINVPHAGNVTVRIDGGRKIIFPVTEGENNIDLGQLSQGNHTIWIEYENDNGTSYYNNYVTIKVGDDGSWLDFPDRIEVNGRDVIRVNVGKDAKGYVLIYIDDKLVDNRTLENGSTEISLTQYLTGDNVYGMHNYTIVYCDENGNIMFSKNGTFNVTYIFHDDIDVRGVPFQEYFVVIVDLPEDATGDVRITVNGQSYTQQAVNGQAVFVIPGLPMGEYDVFVEYLGDDKYPPMGYHTLLNVSHYGVVGEFDNGKRIIRLMLPEDAEGNLTVYNDNRGVVMYSVPLIHGKARIDLGDLPVGIYEIRAYYEGSDYDVKQFSTTFRVMPKVNITQGIVMGDNGTILLDLDNATGHIVIAMDGLSPVVQEIKNGIVNYTFSTEGYSHGNHTVTFLYFGNSFDGNIFFEDDGKTPVEYDLLILPQKTSGGLSSDGDNILEILIYREDGTLATDANEYVTIFVNGMKYTVLRVYNGIARLDISKFKNGDYLISWIYSGNKKYASSAGQANIKVNHKTDRIVAKDASVLYSANNKYSVTVYNADGSLAKGVKVIFLINNRAFKTVKTNSKGVASVIITKNPGNYKITSKTSTASITKTLKVKHVVSIKKVKVKRSAKKLQIKVTLKKVNGKYLKSKKVKLKFNGKKYTAKTNKKGVAKFTIKSKVLKKLKVGKKVKYQASYKKDTVKMSVKVKK